MLSNKIHALSRPVVGLYGRMLKLNVHRHADLPAGPKIIAANHPTTSDPFLIAWITREQARILIVSHAFDVPLFGTYLRKLGHIPVVAREGRRAFDAAEAHLQSGGTLIIFPEGELSPDEGGFREPRTGAARLALRTGAPVIPMGISLSPRAIRYVESTFGDTRVTSRWPVHGPYGVTVGSPMHFRGDVEDRVYVKMIAKRMMQHVMDMAHESRERLHAPYLWPSILEPLSA